MGSNTCSSREHADTLTNGNENLDQSVALVKALGWSGRIQGPEGLDSLEKWNRKQNSTKQT